MTAVETCAGDPTPLSEYIGRVADLLRLGDWRIILHDDEDASDDADGEVNIPFGQKVMNLRFNFTPQHSRKEKRHIIVHELVHAYTTAMQCMVERDLDGELADGTHRVFSRAFRREMEYAVDGLAFVIDAHVPLPPKGC